MNGAFECWGPTFLVKAMNMCYRIIIQHPLYLQLLLHRLRAHERPTRRRPKKLLIVKVPIVVRYIHALHSPRRSNMRAVHRRPDPRQQDMNLPARDAIRPDVIIIPKRLAG